jgi:hypothetical protein
LDFGEGVVVAEEDDVSCLAETGELLFGCVAMLISLWAT